MKPADKISIIPDKQKTFYRIFFIIVICLYILSISQLNLHLKGGLSNFLKAFEFFTRMLHMNMSEWRDVLYAALESISVAILATIISAVFAFFISFMAAGNVSVKFLTWFCKGVAAGIRAVPTLIWTLIFVAFLGLGPFPGVIGLCFHSFAYLVKAYSQSIEDVKEGNIEALKATGASWLQIMARGVVPPIKTALISWTALRFEINGGESSILGLVGAGGIGHELSMAMRGYQFEKAGFVILIIFLMSFSIEMLFHKLKLNVDKRRLKEKQNG